MQLNVKYDKGVAHQKFKTENLLTDPELRVEHRLVLAADGAAVSEGVQGCCIQVSLQFL